MTVINRARREDLPPSVTKVGPIAGEEGQRSKSVPPTPWERKTKREEMVRRAALGIGRAVETAFVRKI